MSIFNGKFRRRGGLTGNVSDQTPQLRVTFTPKNDAPRVTITQGGGFGGAWHRVGKFFSGAPRRLAAIYRFLSFHDRIITKHRAKAISAPAVEMEADSKLAAELEANLTARTVADLTTDSGVKTSLTAKLVAYRRAGLRYIKGMPLKRITKLIAVPGAVAKYKKKMPLTVKIQTTAAPGAVMESRYNRIKENHEAAAISAPAELATLETTFSVGHSTKPSTAAALSVNLDSAFAVTHSAKIVTWIEPVVIDGVLYLRQAYNATKNGDILEVK